MKNKDILYNIKSIAANNYLYILLAAGVIASNACFFAYEKQTQIIENTIDNNDYFINEQGEICKLFEPGKHKIEISKNKHFYRKVEEVPGYAIKESTLYPWNLNRHTIYENTVPVIAKASIGMNGKIEFNHFGEMTIELEEPKLRLER